eukprot:702311-Amphidinium_carterae.1
MPCFAVFDENAGGKVSDSMLEGRSCWGGKSLALSSSTKCSIGLRAEHFEFLKALGTNGPYLHVDQHVDDADHHHHHHHHHHHDHDHEYDDE